MLAFYRDALGLEPVESWDEPGNQGTVLRFAPPLVRFSIEVLDLKGVAVSDSAPRNTDLSLYVDSVADWHERLVANGVPIARGIQDTPWGLRSFGINDPDDLRIWFQERITT